MRTDLRAAARPWLDRCRWPVVSELREVDRMIEEGLRPLVAAYVPPSSAAADRSVRGLVLRFLPVIAVMQQPDPTAIVSLLELGADDVVSTEATPAELLARAAAVTRRRRRENAVPLAMPRAAANLLDYLVRHAGRIVPQRELIREVFGGAHTADTSLVRVHVCQLRERLGDQGHAIKTFRGRGYAVDPTLLRAPPLDRAA